ncbi:bifunctional nuclease family protein [Hugenholtzia roseola]|uniref:bifunctional nuclease family protein n=1 Tax=Hugenholtzia roseola TaxID=1002 RepID=UPI00041BB558|nr:bifunctional nuclease family protein [Hugenholtzia roseola]
MNKIKLEIFALSSSQSQQDSFALVLGEISGKERRLPIIIGRFEAQAIAMELEKIEPKRPMTHDLFAALGKTFHFTIEEIVITGMEEGIFTALIFLKDFRNGEQYQLDARPSDAVALALRFDAPIYAEDSVLEEAGIVPTEISRDDDDDDEEDGEEEEMALIGSKEEAKEEISTNQLSNLSKEMLEQLLQKALEEEDYEKAAKIRDEMQRRA